MTVPRIDGARRNEVHFNSNLGKANKLVSKQCLSKSIAVKDGPLKSLQYAPMKNAADFNGAEVVPTSWTEGIEGGSGVGSTYGATAASFLVQEVIVNAKK